MMRRRWEVELSPALFPVVARRGLDRKGSALPLYLAESILSLNIEELKRLCSGFEELSDDAAMLGSAVEVCFDFCCVTSWGQGGSKGQKKG